MSLSSLGKGHNVTSVMVESRCAFKENGPHAKACGPPVVLLGLTKRWSLYVASTATPGPSATSTPGGYATLTHR